MKTLRFLWVWFLFAGAQVEWLGFGYRLNRKIPVGQQSGETFMFLFMAVMLTGFAIMMLLRTIEMNRKEDKEDKE